MGNFTTTKIQARIRDLEEETDDTLVKERNTLQDIVDTREADRYAKNVENRRAGSNKKVA